MYPNAWFCTSSVQNHYVRIYCGFTAKYREKLQTILRTWVQASWAWIAAGAQLAKRGLNKWLARIVPEDTDNYVIDGGWILQISY